MEERWDCIVIGAGPAGTTTALQCARAGLKTLILERGPEPGSRVACGGGMPYALVRKLSLEKEIDRAIHVVRLWHPSFRQPMTYRFSWPVLAGINRTKFDRILARRAMNAGAILLNNHRVLNVTIDRKAEVFVRTRDGDRVFFSEVIVFADGATTLAYPTLGIGFNPHDQLCAYAVKLRVKFEEDLIDSSAFDFILDENRLFFGYFWIFPKEGYINIGVGTLKQAERRYLDPLIIEFLKLRGLNPASMTIMERRGGLIPLEPARRWVTDRALVVGDAAGFVNAVTGGGLVYAIRSGELAGQTIVRAFQHGRWDEKILKMYERRFRWSRHGLWLKGMHGLIRGVWHGYPRLKSGYRFLFQWYFRLNPLFARIRSV